MYKRRGERGGQDDLAFFIVLKLSRALARRTAHTTRTHDASLSLSLLSHHSFVLAVHDSTTGHTGTERGRYIYIVYMYEIKKVFPISPFWGDPLRDQCDNQIIGSSEAWIS